MRITCLITVCAYLSSTVSTDEIQYFNKLKKVRSREELVLDDATAKKEMNLNTGIHPNLSTLRKSQSQGQIENFQKNTHKSQPKSQRHPRDRLRSPIKRLKARSIAGSTYELNNNEITHESIPEVHNEGPIYIKPVVRVVKHNSIFDSIMDILHQLVESPKKELGPIVGPIKMPGSKRKIYLRLMEPVDSSHINVRFVTQVPVPVIDEDAILSREHDTILPFLPFGDPDITLLHRHPIASNDVTFSSSNHHHSVQFPRNASHVSGKGQRSQLKSTIKLKSPPEDLKETVKENVSPVKVEVTSGAISNQNHLYYQYPSEDDAVKQVTEIIKDTTENEQDSKDSLEPWYELSTHRLPLRQIAPLYPLSTMEYTDSPDSYEDTYKVPSDSLIVPSLQQTNSYEQYSNVNAETSGFYDQSSHIVPNTYATTYQKQNEFSNAPSSYPISYQNQNEFNNAPSSTSYVKQNDLFSAPTTHTNSYKKPTNVPPPSSSYEAPNDVQTGSSSQDALHVIDPPDYFLDPRKVLGNHANKVFEPITIQQQSTLSNVNEIGSLLHNTKQNGKLPIDQVIWGKVKREKSESDFQNSETHFLKNELNFQKSESNFQKSTEITSDNNHEKWQPLTFESENRANLAKVVNDNHHVTTVRQQSVNHPREISRNTTSESTIETGRMNRQSGKRRNHSVTSTRNSRCSTSDKGDRCERTESITSTSHPEGIIKIMEEQTQLAAANVESIVITPKSVTSNTVEKLKSNIAIKSSWIEEPQPLVMTIETPTTSTTEKSLSIKLIKNMTEKAIENKISKPMNNILEKSAANSTTEKSPISSTSKAFITRNNTTKRLQLPKRPTIMKKPTFVLKEMELSSTTKGPRRTTNNMKRKPTMDSTTEKMKTTKRLKFQRAISKTKSTTR